MALFKTTNGNLALFASMLLMVIFGSVHAFSVFLLPMETHFQTSRSAISMIYSLALISLTIAVFLGHRFYGLIKPSTFVIACCLLASFGVLITAFTNHILIAYIGYGVMFGFANGLAYGFCLNISAQSNDNRKGLAIGMVTASYALGPILAPWPLTKATEVFGLNGSLISFALVILIVMPIAASLFHKCDIRLKLNNADNTNKSSDPLNKNKTHLIKAFWLSYGLAVTAGLMTIGHATGIAEKGGVRLQLVVIAPITIAVFNMLGSLLGGWMVDHFKPRISLCTLPLISALSLLALSQFLNGESILIGLAFVGFAYGAIIAAYPAVISALFGAIDSIRIYGLVFTAWGAAGFFGPWVAGIFYDNWGNYNIALVIAAFAGILSATVAFFAI